MDTYFSEREGNRRARTSEEIPSNAWAGIAQEILARIEDESFGDSFPYMCEEGQGNAGLNRAALEGAVRAEHPEISWPPRNDDPPSTLAVLDLLEFCHAYVGKPDQGRWHWNHFHMSYDLEAGQQAFRDRVNRIFSRNGIAFEMQKDGSIVRLGHPILHEGLTAATFATGDDKLDELLDGARRKFLSPDSEIRREAVEKLWDAFERAKTLEAGADKKAMVQALLDRAVPDGELRKHVESEMHTLTSIGNQFHIRHSETTQNEVRRPDDIDYLFHRLFSLVCLLLRTTGRM